MTRSPWHAVHLGATVGTPRQGQARGRSPGSREIQRRSTFPDRQRDFIARHEVYHSNPDILVGTPVFTGTRVPVQNLLDYLAAGQSLAEFLEGFPGVTREQAVAFLALARSSPPDGRAASGARQVALALERQRRGAPEVHVDGAGGLPAFRQPTPPASRRSGPFGDDRSFGA